MAEQGKRATGRKADTPAARTAARPGERATRPRRQPATETEPEAPATIIGSTVLPARLRRGLGITQRAFVLIVVVIVLLVSYMTTLRVHFNQQYQIAQTRAQIQAHEDAISTLEDEIARWQDPEYVKIQARERLGWVLPGEIGFRVIGPDGEPYGGGQQIGVGRLPDGEYQTTWWDRMWGSVQTADDPTGGEPEMPDEPVRPEPSPSDGP